MLVDSPIAQDRIRTSTRLRLSPASVGFAAAGLCVADWGSQLAGGSVIPGAPLDEMAHVLTVVLVLWALGPGPSERFMLPAAVAAVAIDADHVPGQLGAYWLTAGTPRPYPHSLLTVAVVLAAALVWRRRRDLLLGVALGALLHLWRDVSETGSGAPLLWPFSSRPVRLSHASYLAVMGLVVAVGLYRTRAGQR